MALCHLSPIARDAGRGKRCPLFLWGLLRGLPSSLPSFWLLPSLLGIAMGDVAPLLVPMACFAAGVIVGVAASAWAVAAWLNQRGG